MNKKIAKIFQAITYWPAFLTLKLLFRWKIEGQENLKGLEDKSVIFASNHASYLVDHPFCGYSLPRSSFYPHKFFPIHFLAYKEFFSIKNRYPFPLSILVTLYVKINNSISITPTNGDLETALIEPIKELNKGAKLWTYPEGWVTRDGEIQQGKRGTAYLHKKTGAVIIPVGLSGTFRFKFLDFLNRKKVKIKFGEPIYSLGDTSLEEGMEIVMDKIKELVDPR